MRKQALLGLLALLGLCVSVPAAAEAADERPVSAEKSVVSRSETADADTTGGVTILSSEPGIPPGVETPLLDPHTVFNHVIVAPGGKIIQAGVDTGEDGSTAGPGEHLIYENTLGINIINFPSNQPVSDDISTIAPDGCKLTRYKFKVLGKVIPTGTGGPFTVTYGLYTNCPLAVGSTNAQRDLVKIPGTDGVLSFPDETPQTIEHIVDALTPVSLPNNVYLSIRFNRGNCGTVIGAPATTGYSGDIWDFPGFPCNGFLGGFPQLPQASFWVQMYGSTDCTPAFSGYKCQRPSGGPALIGANVQGVDDVKLIVNNCQMIGYEVAVKGVGFYTFDLRRDCEGGVVAGTERTFAINASTTPLLQVARFTFSPPITLTTDRYFLGFKCSSNSSGAIVAGIQPIIGESTSDYFTIGLDGCSPILPTQGVHGAINFAITCAGAQPIGACCDPYLPQCKGGPDDGKRCPGNATCVGGADNGKPCSPSTLCASPGVCTPTCAAPGTCEAVCRVSSQINCPFPQRGQDQRPAWQQGKTCEPKCVGGTQANNPCTTNADCPGGQCNPFGPSPCGVSSCCHLSPDPDNPNNLIEVCDNMTKNVCEAAIPTDRARLWQLGEYCGVLAQRCPRNACLARDGSCYIAHNTPGCQDPFCCTDVCAHGTEGAFCCNTAWDAACVAFADIDCPTAPPNDQCAPNDPVPGLSGALPIPVPGSIASSNLTATESIQDPGFCCNNGVGTCIGGPTDGQSCIVNTDCESSPGNPAVCSERFPDPGAPALGTIWFKFTQGTGTSAGISTCTSNSPALDSVLQVFEPNDTSSDANACKSLSVIGCNDDALNCSSTGRNSRVCLRGLTPGKTYYILLGSKTENRRGQYIVTISTSCSGPNSDPIPNDYCKNATNITDPTPLDPLVVPFALGRVCLSGAGTGKPCTQDAECRVCSGGLNAGQVCTGNANCPGGSCPTVPSGVCPTGGPTFECPAESCSPGAQEDVWFNYTATCTADAIFSTCGPGNPDTNIAVYDGCTTCPSTSNNASSIACNKDAELQGCFEPARVVVPVIQGQCYKVRVANQGGFPVAGNLTITCPPNCPGVGDCEPDGVCDDVEIANCPPGNNDCHDCNGNGKPDFCDIRDLVEQDCQPNGKPDSCELAGNDCQPDGIPDDCVCNDPCCVPSGCSGFVSSTPADCTIDARQPYPPSQPGNSQLANSLTMTFGQSCNAVPGDFSVTCSPTAAPCPTVQSVNAAGAVQTITLSTPIPAGNWTCVRHTGTGAKVCMGSLPGDADGGRTTAAADILKVIDNINGIVVPALTPDHCDIDRSGACVAADILRVIDLLNGVTGYAVWNGVGIPVCPAP